MEAATATADRVERALALGNGILRLEPTWVARDLVPPGRRLGLPEDAYDVGERGFICERWLGSTTRADNRVGPPDEGLSYLALDDGEPPLTLDAAVRAAPRLLMGDAYAATHTALGRLPKVFDYGYRLPYHLHLRPEHAALVGRHSKDEAYYFPSGFDEGRHPETFFGVHPWIAETGSHDVLLPYLETWDSDRILEHARGFLQAPDEGFDVPSGVLHAPGTRLTVELQEDSDVLAILQAKNAGRIVSKELLFKDVSAADRARLGERFILGLIDWQLNGDPHFYENRHLVPVPIAESSGSGTAAGGKAWIFYNNPRFSGKRLTVPAGATYRSMENGVYNVWVLRGGGTIGGVRVRGGEPGEDELFVSHDAAVRALDVVNDGAEDLVVVEFFGPDINPDAPSIVPPRPR